MTPPRTKPASKPKKHPPAPVPAASSEADCDRIGVHAVHRLAPIFPDLSPAEQEVLEANMASVGQVAPILRHRGAVLVGLAVLRACLKLGLAPAFTDLPDAVDPLEALLSHHLDRRHLTRSQRAMAAGRVATLGPGRPETGQRCTFSAEEAAKRFGISPRLVKSARAVLRRQSPALTDLADRGLLSVTRGAALTALDDEALATLVERVGQAASGSERAEIIREVLESAGLAAAAAGDAPARLMKESVEVLAAHVREAEAPADALGSVFEDLARQAGLRLRGGVGGLLAGAGHDEAEDAPDSPAPAVGAPDGDAPMGAETTGVGRIDPAAAVDGVRTAVS